MKTIAIGVLTIAFAAGAYAQQGHKETDRLIKKAESMQKDPSRSRVPSPGSRSASRRPVPSRFRPRWWSAGSGASPRFRC